MSMQNQTIGRRWMAIYPAISMIFFFLIPFGIMFAVSFFKRIEGESFQAAFVFSNYEKLLSPFFAKIVGTSLGISLISATISLTIAFPFVYLLSRYKRSTQAIVLVFILSVLSLSEVIIGFAWSTLLSQTAGIGNLFAGLGIIESPVSYTPSLLALVLGLSYLGFPYAVLIIYPSVSRLDPDLLEAARMLGASPTRSFFNIILPIMRNTLLGAFILVFVFTLGAYVLPQVLGRPEHWTLSVHITDQAVFHSNLPLSAAMAIFLLLVSIALVGLSFMSGTDKGGRK